MHISGMTSYQQRKGITHVFTVKQYLAMATVSEACATSAKIKTDGVDNFVWVEGGKRVGVRKLPK